MSEHETYEILCAWVASGRASAEDLDQLGPHLRACDECRQRISDFAQVSAQALPLHGEGYRRKRLPSGMTLRFVEQARLHGIPLRRSSRLWSLRHHYRLPGLMWATGSVAVVLVVVIAMGSAHGRWGVKSDGPPITTQRHESAPAQIEPKSVPVLDESQPLRAQVSGLQNEIADLKMEANNLQQDLMASDSSKTEISSRMAKIEKDNIDLRFQVSAKDSLVGELQSQIKQKDSSNSEAIAARTLLQTEMESLRATIVQRESQLETERQLLAASTQAKDLIVARNLHIIDVHDNDRSGRQRPFGRIFYTEGQALVFYAYDLDAATQRNAKVSFHVWGGKLSDHPQPAKNLGIFHNEDASAGRWVLTFDDPRVLAQINTVFVTVEPNRGEFDRPNGKRILYAFLGDPANHP